VRSTHTARSADSEFELLPLSSMIPSPSVGIRVSLCLLCVYFPVLFLHYVICYRMHCCECVLFFGFLLGMYSCHSIECLDLILGLYLCCTLTSMGICVSFGIGVSFDICVSFDTCVSFGASVSFDTCVSSYSFPPPRRVFLSPPNFICVYFCMRFTHASLQNAQLLRTSIKSCSQEFLVTTGTLSGRRSS